MVSGFHKEGSPPPPEPAAAQREVSPEAAAQFLVMWADWRRSPFADALEATLAMVEDRSLWKKVEQELVFLRAFSIAYAFQAAYGDGAVTKHVLSQFYAGLKAMADERGTPELCRGLGVRCALYAAATRQAASPSDIPFAMGTMFAEACGKPNTYLLALAGMNAHTQIYLTLIESPKAFKVQ